MSYSKTKSTKRFDFTINRNYTSKKGGSNLVTIATRPEDGRYSIGSSEIRMTVKEATALQNFLNNTLSNDNSSII